MSYSFSNSSWTGKSKKWKTENEIENEIGIGIGIGIGKATLNTFCENPALPPKSQRYFFIILSRQKHGIRELFSHAVLFVLFSDLKTRAYAGRPRAKKPDCQNAARLNA